MAVQGISGAQKIVVLAASGPGYDGFLVKNWSFVEPGSSSDPYRYIFRSAIAPSECIDEPGVPGQGNSNPPADFVNHFIVKYGGEFYDPSYGTGPFSSQRDWENASLDGFLIVGMHMGQAAVLAKRNAPDVIETEFIVVQ